MNHISKHAPISNNVKLFNEWVILLVITVVLFLASCTNAPDQMAAAPAPSLPVITVSQSSQETFVDYPASIQGATDLEIRPQIAGTIDRVLVNEGQLVSKGQLLFQISELPFRAQLNNAKAALQAAKSAVLNAQLEIDKLTPLVQAKVVSAFQLQTAKTAHEIALANVEQAKSGVNSAQINLNYTQIKAPISGYIGRLPKKQGSLVGPTDVESLTQLSDVHEVHVYFSLAETDFINFNAKYQGNSVADRIKHLPSVSLVLADQTIYPSEGKIDMIDGQFDKTTGAITLRASFANAQGLLRSGNTGKVRMSLEHNNILLVPQASTIEIQDKVFVFAVSKDNKISKQPIKVLGTSGTNYLVEDGLKSGDQIVSKGFESLKEGDLIQPEKAKAVTAYNASNK
ncbi:efflux RND transporter periplasmic adaptor subunit [Pedobacter sp. LMG 31464]|uniref:Efflux RND transporter periplasmic adaptor subunit n=1 Tax=Pedobacter planticolens TaxID=2679964 RepID=A0A923IVR3_9SPHI|nr:efflux RND transporter periplasmic adaptor subunit [Pedobacter planticolens]MBB2145424.1 efflux RND transporter periplasmic adaptor subunit [Pedobacter planticolens]